MDLQVHSPFEPEFAPGVNRLQADKVAAAARTFVDAAVTAQLEAVAVTDHNSVAFLPYLREAARGRLVVFPGVELSASDGYHILCLFEPDTAQESIRE